MLKVKGIRLRNWMTVKEAELVFPDTGFIHVVGENRTSGKVSSIGSGKSALGDAVHRVLFDVAGRFAYLRDYSRDGDGDTYVCVECELHGSPMTVELGFKCEELSTSGEGLRYTVGGNTVQMDSIKNTRAALTAAIGIPPELAEWTVAVDGDRMKFGKLSQMNGVAVVMAALQQPPWADYHEKAKAAATRYESAYAAATTAVNTHKAVLAESAEDVEDAKAAYDAALAEDVQSMRKSKTRCEAEIAKWESKLAEATKCITDQSARIVEERGQLEQQRLALVSERSALKDELARAVDVEDLEDSLNPGTCRSCGQPKPPLPPEKVKVIKAKIKQEKAKTRPSNDLRALLRDVESAIDAKFTAMAGVGLNETRKASQTVEEAQRNIRSISRDLADVTSKLEAHDRAVAAKKAAWEHCKSALVDRERAYQKALEDQADACAATVFGDYWKQAFAPSGIPNMVLQHNLPALNSLATTVSDELTGGLLGVEFSGDVELTSGQTRNKLNIRATNRYGGPKVEGSSKGESGLINVVLAETMARVGGVIDKVRWRWFDEVINSQDPTVRASILAWLRNSGGLTFLVDHHAEVENYATHRLVATKDRRGITSYRWE